MHLEEFAEGGSVIHHMDSRVKLLAGLPVIGFAAISQSFTCPLGVLLMALALAVTARLDARKLAVRLLGVNLFVLALWVFVPFSAKGEAAFTLGPLTATREGLTMAALITVKTNAIVIMSIALLGTSEAMSLAHALVHLRVPVRLVYLFFFFYRYLSVLHGEYTRLRDAMRLRAFRMRSTLHTYRSAGWLIGMLIVRSHDRAGRVYEAMLCRGFRGRFPVMRHFHLHGADIVIGASLVVMGAGLWAWGMA